MKYKRIRKCSICSFKFVSTVPRDTVCQRCHLVFGHNPDYPLYHARYLIKLGDMEALKEYYKKKHLEHKLWMQGVPPEITDKHECHNITDEMISDCKESENERMIRVNRYTYDKKSRMRTCTICGNEFRFFLGERHSCICPICRYVLSIGRHSEYVRKLSQEIKRNGSTKKAEMEYAAIYRSLLTKDIKRYVPATLKGELPIPGRNPRMYKAMDIFMRSITLEELDNKLAEQRLNEQIEAASKKTFKCSRCAQTVTRKDVGDGLCEHCKKMVEYQSTKWFKGVVGLPDKPMEYIAKLPAYAREQYTKHMTDSEKVDLFEVVRRNRPKPSMTIRPDPPDMPDDEDED